MRFRKFVWLIWLLFPFTLSAQDLNYHLQRGFDLQIKNNYHDAINLYDSLLQIWVNEPNILYQKALCLIRMNRADEAFSNFQLIIKLRPAFVGGYYGAATACVAMEQWEQAFDFIEKTIALEAENSEYYLLRGRILVGLNRIKEACKDFKKAKKMGNMDAPFAISNYCK